MFDKDQTKSSKPLLVDPLNMYPQNPNNHEMAQPTLSNTPTMRFPLKTSPTQRMVQ